MGFNLTKLTPMSGSHVFMLSPNVEKCAKFFEKWLLTGWIRPDWGNSACADMAVLGSMLTLIRILAIFMGNTVLWLLLNP